MERVFSSKLLYFVVSVFVVAVPARAQLPDTSYRLIFADEFLGTTLDTSKWSAASPGWTMPNAASTASAAQVSVANNFLTLNAVRTSSTAFSSGSVSTYQKYNLAGGYVEARIKLPTTPGSWPAFWGLYTGWPPEADIMEYPLTTNGGTSGLQSNQYSTNYHYTNTSGSAAAGAGAVTTGSSLAGTTHNFGMEWVTGTSVKFYLDGQVVSSYTGTSVAQMVNMYMILDYAVGGWPGTPSTSQWAIGASDQTLVDWVRVWQKNSNGDNTTNWNINGGGAFTTSGNWSAGVPMFGNQTALFGRVGTAATAAVSMDAWTVLGNITFAGAAGGTTAYTLGASGNVIQLASTAGATVQAASTSTVSQTINAGVELWSDTTFRNDMTGGQALVFNGVITGNGNLTVVGAGPVQFANNNEYLGDTTIGTSATPTATVLVTRSRPFGTSGTVNLGIQGNSNAAVIQIQDGRTVPNSIVFAGRGASTTDNVTPGIQNLNGNNVFSGTISLGRGGANYIVQSDAGLLTLSGTEDSTTPGIALQSGSGATGTRTLTFQGVGNGNVTGLIQNGAATTFGIVKAGSGTWTLSADNPYNGQTTVAAGKLIVNGTHSGGGVVSVSSGATLAGTGGLSAINLIAGGSFAPGTTGIGTLRATALTWNSDNIQSGGQYDLSTTDATSDRLTLTGALVKGSGTAFPFDFTGGKVGTTYTLMTFTSTTFTSSSDFTFSPANQATGYAGLFIVSGTSLALTLTAVPESNALLALGMGGLAVAGFFRRRHLASDGPTDEWPEQRSRNRERFSRGRESERLS